MRNAECGMRNAECGNAECGMRNAEGQMRKAKCVTESRTASSFRLSYSAFRIPHSALHGTVADVAADFGGARWQCTGAVALRRRRTARHCDAAGADHLD